VRQHLGDDGVVVAAVVVRTARNEIGKLVAANEVAAPDLDAVEPARGGEVDRRLEIGRRLPKAAHRFLRRLVRGDLRPRDTTRSESCQALENDMQAGVLKPGTRLLPQRDMANQRGLSVGTVSRAYAEADARGLISGEVGRGTFVQRRRPPASAPGNAQATINLALNVPPSTGEEELIASVLSEIPADGALSPLLGNLPHQCEGRHRQPLHQAWRPTCAFDRPQHGGDAKRHGADGTLHLFRNDRAVGAERIQIVDTVGNLETYADIDKDIADLKIDSTQTSPVSLWLAECERLAFEKHGLRVTTLWRELPGQPCRPESCAGAWTLRRLRPLRWPSVRW
jgi:hypothetical protein